MLLKKSALVLKTDFLYAFAVVLRQFVHDES